MRLGIVGTRGIPAKYGGFETFAQELSCLLAARGMKITVYCDKPEGTNSPETYKNVSLGYLGINKTHNPLLFYFLGLWQSMKRDDIVLVTGTGGSIFYFMNIFFRKIIITNTDGLESRRSKWSFIKRTFIKLTEYMAIKLSTHIIADSKAISDYIIQKYVIKREKIETIEYGAFINNLKDDSILAKYSLKQNDYYLVVARLVPENNIKMIIDGYKESRTQKSLIIIGNITSDNYVKCLLKECMEKIRFLGGIYDQTELSVLRFSAFAYIHGHSVGGTNPSLLEALASSNVSICHDNDFTREVTCNTQLYFNNSGTLGARINELERMNENKLLYLKKAAKDRIENYYTWENISDKYFNMISKITNNNS